MLETIIFLVLFAILVSILIFGNDNQRLSVNVKSLKSGENFIVEKRVNSKGNEFLDWFYYDENGNKIEDEKLKLMIFEAFGDEDWYGDYEFYTNAETKEEKDFNHHSIT